MSKADRMFKELGFEEIKKIKNEVWCHDLTTDKAIHFSNDKYIEILGDFEIIEFELLQAINEKCKELGWINNVK